MPKAISKNLTFLKQDYWGDGVCAWAAVSPYETVFRRFNSQKEGVEWFRNYGRDKGWSNHGDPPYIDFYPQCNKCEKDANYHHFPNGVPVRYVVGPRGGVIKQKAGK